MAGSLNIAQGLPYLTQYDPANAEGPSIDPLSLAPLGDQLAYILCPGVTERMRNPLFLTHIAIGKLIAQDCLDVTHASDENQTPFELVYEWHIVEALLAENTDETILGLPGSDKVKEARRKGVHLNADRYLKTASVFGVHGVYRTLCRQLKFDQGIFKSTALAEIWEGENSLKGFVQLSNGAGAQFRDSLSKSVREGMESGQVTDKSLRRVKDNIRKHLHPNQISPLVRAHICGLIREGGSETSREILRFMDMPEHRTTLQDGVTAANFFKQIFTKGSIELKSILSAIFAYETFCRTLFDGFYDILRELHVASKQVDRSALMQLYGIKNGWSKISQEARTATECLKQYDGLAVLFQNQFAEFFEVSSADDFFNKIVNYHFRIQKNKVPQKLPWVILIEKESKFVLDRLYGNREFTPLFNDEFVNFYRVRPLFDFLQRTAA